MMSHRTSADGPPIPPNCSHSTHAQISNLFWISLSVSAGVTLLQGMMAPGIAWFYGEPRLVEIVLAFAAVGMFTGLTIQHRGLLRRQMRFGTLSAVDIAAAIAGVTAAVTAALLGAGYWALVLERFVAALVTTSGVWIACEPVNVL